MFKDIDAYSTTLTKSATRGKGLGLPCPFLKIKKGALILGKKTLLEKTPNCFTAGPFIEVS